LLVVYVEIVNMRPGKAIRGKRRTASWEERGV
jgi:hypothetical protein